MLLMPLNIWEKLLTLDVSKLSTSNLLSFLHSSNMHIMLMTLFVTNLDTSKTSTSVQC